MNALKYIWGTFFRLFPCPTRIRLARIGHPGRQSPVLATCNFYITVRRLFRKLRGLDVWVIIADSKGVNVWCAAGADQFNTRSVVSAVKTSGISERVDHRILVLPPLSAPGIQAREVKKQTGWSIHWGPVRMKDIPAYLNNRQRRTEEMKRVTFNWRERLDTAGGCLFPFFFVGAVGFLVFGPGLLLNYLVIGPAAFFFFMLTCPWLPGRRGLTKVILPQAILASVWVATEVFNIPRTLAIRPHIIITMVMLLIYSSELGGLAPTMPSDLDAFLARMGFGAIGNVAFAGTVRTELLNGLRVLTYYRTKCVGCRNCVEVCPQGCWELDDEQRAILAQKENCTACRACLVQCEGGAIKAEPTSRV